MALYYPPTSDFIQKTLGAELLSGATSAATLNNVTAIQNKAGVMIIDRIDTNNNETPSKVEVISFAGTSGSTVTTLVRGLAGTTDQDHAVGAIVEFGPDIIWAQGLIDTFLTEHGTDGTHSAITATSVNIGSTIAVTGVLDEDTMSSNSAVKLATQQSIKAYSDQKALSLYVVDATTDLATGDGKIYFVIPSYLNNLILKRIHGRVITAGTTGTTDIQIANVTDSVDVLSTKLTIDSGETGSDTAATPAVINTSNDDAATNDLWRVDIDAVSTTAPQGLIITLEFANS